MTIARLIELLEKVPVPDDTEITVDAPGLDIYNDEYFEEEFLISGVCVYNNGSVHLKLYKSDEE
jgi:hypothetical protein